MCVLWGECEGGNGVCGERERSKKTYCAARGWVRLSGRCQCHGSRKKGKMAGRTKSDPKLTGSEEAAAPETRESTVLAASELLGAALIIRVLAELSPEVMAYGAGLATVVTVVVQELWQLSVVGAGVMV